MIASTIVVEELVDEVNETFVSVVADESCDVYLFSCIFILLSRESDQSAMRARLGVASHLSTTPRWGIPLSAFPNGTTSKLAGLFSTLSLQC